MRISAVFQRWRGLWLLSVGVLLCAVGAWATAVLREESKPSKAPSRIVDKAPLRGERQPLRLRRLGFTYKCNECHRSFLNPPGRRPLRAEHTDVTLNHGQNDYCLNCHHRANRNAYVAHDGSEISADDVPKLCSKCHGLIHRDWMNGVHGRSGGFWSERHGERQRLICVQCHDPHNPKFPQLAPMPKPGGATAMAPANEHQPQKEH